MIFDVPMKLRLELMAVVGADLSDAKREFLDDVVCEVDGIGLGMVLVDFQGSYPSSSSAEY